MKLVQTCVIHRVDVSFFQGTNQSWIVFVLIFFLELKELAYLIIELQEVVLMANFKEVKMVFKVKSK